MQLDKVMIIMYVCNSYLEESKNSKTNRVSFNYTIIIIVSNCFYKIHPENDVFITTNLLLKNICIAFKANSLKSLYYINLKTVSKIP